MRNNLAKTLVCIAVVIIALSFIVFSGCQGSSDCSAPALDATGTWCVRITSSSGTCVASDTTPYPAVFTQNGNNVSATANTGTYSGTICGNMVTMTGSNWGFNTTTRFTFSDADNGTGTTSYDNGNCRGTDTVTAVRGSCP